MSKNFHEEAEVEKAKVFLPTPGQTVALHIKVKDLPEGYFKERLMLIALNHDTEVWVVATFGWVNDWSAYIGWPAELSEYGDKQDTTHWYRLHLSTEGGTENNGDKISEAEAKEVFKNYPNIVKLSYRR